MLHAVDLYARDIPLDGINNSNHCTGWREPVVVKAATEF
jgi:hypothetical protein